MQTKSNIQIMLENLAIRDAFKTSIESFMDKYIIEDSYFGISQKKSLDEYNKGYFVFEHEYDNINDAIINMTPNHVIRIIENKRFQIGKIYEKLSEAIGDRIIDITSGAIVQND